MEEETKKTTRFGEIISIPEEHAELIKKRFEDMNNLCAGAEIMLAEIGIKRNILWKGIREVIVDKNEYDFDKRAYTYNGETNTLTDIGPNPSNRDY